jgi:hypothetical protein
MKRARQSPLEKERQRRICVAIWAYAYEYLSASIVSDQIFDKTCREIDLKVSTGNREMDTWFRKNFQPDTGQWVGAHPRRDILHRRATVLCEQLGLIYVDRGILLEMEKK